MSNPFDSNPNYTLVFNVREYNKCDAVEIVNLYRRNNPGADDAKYALLRLVATSVNNPIRTIHKFNDLLSTEFIDDGRLSLYITTVYGKESFISSRFHTCCGTRVFVENVEKEILKHLL